MSDNPQETDEVVEEQSKAEELEESPETEGLEGESQEETDESDADDEVEYITLDGEDLTLDQIKEMKQGQLRQSDYTRKTQALADQRKAAQTLADNLEASIQAIELMINEEENDPNLDELLEDDPGEYLKREKQLKAKRKKLDNAKKQHGKALQQKTQQESEALVNLMASDWSDKKTQDRDIKLCMQYAEKIGFNNDDLSKFSDHRVYKALIDAAKYEQLKANNPSVKKRKVSAIKKTSKKAAPKQTNEQKTLGQMLYGG